MACCQSRRLQPCMARQAHSSHSLRWTWPRHSHRQAVDGQPDRETRRSAVPVRGRLWGIRGADQGVPDPPQDAKGCADLCDQPPAQPQIKRRGLQRAHDRHRGAGGEDRHGVPADGGGHARQGRLAAAMRTIRTRWVHSSPPWERSKSSSTAH
jgi:hypothetical protein